MRHLFFFVSWGALVTSLAAIGCSSPTPTDDAGPGDDADRRDTGGHDAGSDAGAAGDAGADAGGCADEDGDTHAAASCGGDDCDDTDPTRHPGATETCDAAGVDEDCDPTTVGTRDADGDGYQDAACCNGTTCGPDCDDHAIGVHPDAPEVCNSRDDDCDSATDEGVQIAFYADCDGDGVGGGAAMQLCTPSSCSGHPAVTSSSDCDDTRPEVRPGASETCNDRDDDCNGNVDDGAADASCPAIPHGTPACHGGTCGLGACATGRHFCTDACLLDDDIQSCGASCTPCPTPTHGHATCDGTRCGVVCDSGFVQLGSNCDLPPPRPIAPLSTSMFNCRQAAFRWELGPGTTGARVEICSDRACSTVLTTFDATGNSGVAGLDLTPGLVFWRLWPRAGTTMGAVPSPTWELYIRPRLFAPIRAGWGTSVDVNGDGFSDLLVGAGGAHASAGRVYVYHGSASGIGSTPTTVLDAPAGGEFGSSVASAGDVDGDGYSDVVVGARAANAAYVYRGGPSGLATTPTTTMLGAAGSELGASVAGVGDFDLDGYGDVLVGAPGTGTAYLYRGSPIGTVTSASSTFDEHTTDPRFGESVAGAGDFTNSGYGYVAIASPSGRVYVYGSSTRAYKVLPGALLGSPGEVNGDVFTDVVASDGTTGYVHQGRPISDPPSYSVSPAQFLSSVGDVDGDGYDEVVSLTAAGPRIHRGSSAGPGAGVPFGSGVPDRVTSLGDVNRDGLADFAVSTFGSEQVEVFHGTTGGLMGLMPAVTLVSPVGAAESFGASIARAACIPLSDADARSTPWCEASETTG